MSLSEIMSNAGLAMYAEIALVIFLIVFVGVVLRVFLPSRRREMEDAARQPLADDDSTTSNHPASRTRKE